MERKIEWNDLSLPLKVGIGIVYFCVGYVLGMLIIKGLFLW